MTNPQSLAVAKVAGIFYSFLLQKSGYLEYEENPERIEKLMDKNKTYILYCDRGRVSMAFARELDKKGYHVKSVLGGLTTYRGNNIWESDKSND